MGQHSTLERATGDKYIDGARPTRERDVRKVHTTKQRNDRSPTKNPTILREEQRHNPLLLFPSEGQWFTRGRGIRSTTKARDKIATLVPLSEENFDLDGAQAEGWVFHYLDTQPFHEGMSRNDQEGLGWPTQWVEPLFIPPLPTAPRKSLLGEGLSYQARTQPLPQPNHQQKSSPKQTHQPPPPFRESQLWKPAPLAHAFRRKKHQAPPL